MRSLLSIVVSAAVLGLAACGDSGASSVVGTYHLDKTAFAAEMRKQMGGEKSEPPEAAKLREQMLKTMTEKMNVELRLDANNSWTATFDMPAMPGAGQAEKEHKAEGTWKLEGTELTLTTTKENGKPSSDVKKAQWKDGEISMRPGKDDASPPLVLKKS